MKPAFKLIALSALLLLWAVVVKADQFGDFAYTSGGTNITIIGYTGTNLSVAVPDNINGLPVANIGNLAFAACPSLTSITFGTNITTIGYEAFYGCVMTSITLPAGVVSIGDNAFYYCSRLTNIIIPNKVISIGDRTFYMCSNLTSITIGNSVTNIGNEAFRDCANLIHVAFPTNVTSIGSGAFLDCASLTNFTLPNSLTNIGNYAFSGCAHLTSVIIPTNITSINTDVFSGCATLTNVSLSDKTIDIGVEAFGNCTGLTSINIPDSVISIGMGAFGNCGLTNIMIPSTVTNIANSAFSGCSELMAIMVDVNNPAFSSVLGILFDKNQTTLIECPGGKTGAYTVPNGVCNIGGAFSLCRGLTNITISDSVTNIGESAFSGCTGLTSLTIGTNITSIGNWAFSGCTSLTRLIIPSSVTNFGYYVSAYCTSLAGIYFQGNAPRVDSFAFANENYATIYYLPGTTGWDGFSNLVGLSIALWLPQVQTNDGNFGVRTNRFGFNINWASGQTVVVEACTNLSKPVWQPVQTNTLTTGSAGFSDPQWTNFSGRFYRLRSP